MLKFNLTSAKFCSWLNEYLPTLNLDDKFPKEISEVTAFRYMKKLGFTSRPYHQGYTDWHERPDVVEYRKSFLQKLRFLESVHLPPPICEDGIASWNSGDPSKSRYVIFLYHDETVFNANDAQGTTWVDPEGRGAIRPKGKGRGLMISDYIEEFGGYLRLTQEQLVDARREFISFPREARDMLEFQRDSYWDNERFMRSVRKAVRIAEYKYPSDQYDLVWIFDHSSGHQAYSEDALVASLMNVKPGGKQPKMHPGRLPDGTPQSMVFMNGTPKGLDIILRERGVNTDGLNRLEMVKRMQEFPDFKHEKTSVQQFLEGKHHRCLFNPKVIIQFG